MDVPFRPPKGYDNSYTENYNPSEEPLRNSYFGLRHGQSLANLEQRIISAPEVGCQQYGLSELGHKQASGAANGLDPKALFVSSDFLRAHQTALLAATSLGAAEPRLEPALRERFFGEFEGQTAESYPLVWQRDSQGDHCWRGVESPLALTRRMAGVVEGLEQSHQGRTIVLVSHGDPLRFLQLWFEGRPFTEHARLPHFEPAELRRLG
ncbi:MAG: histidine phosphatase family protein [Vulcanimicrobiota bacterium]